MALVISDQIEYFQTFVIFELNQMNSVCKLSKIFLYYNELPYQLCLNLILQQLIHVHLGTLSDLAEQIVTTC